MSTIQLNDHKSPDRAMQSYAARKGARRESAKRLNQIVEEATRGGEMHKSRFAILGAFRR